MTVIFYHLATKDLHKNRKYYNSEPAGILLFKMVL